MLSLVKAAATGFAFPVPKGQGEPEVQGRNRLSSVPLRSSAATPEILPQGGGATANPLINLHVAGQLPDRQPQPSPALRPTKRNRQSTASDPHAKLLNISVGLACGWPNCYEHILPRWHVIAHSFMQEMMCQMSLSGSPAV